MGIFIMLQEKKGLSWYVIVVITLYLCYQFHKNTAMYNSNSIN